MAEIRNETGSLRWTVDVVDREAPVRGPISVVTEDGRVPAGRLVATSAVEFFDRRDGQFWPLIRLPALYLGGEEVAALLDGVGELVRGEVPGFAWRGGGDVFGVQIGLPPDAAGTAAPESAGLLLEVGVDLGVFLAEAAGAPRRPGAELALFRFPVDRATLVRFGDELKREVEAHGSR